MDETIMTENKDTCEKWSNYETWTVNLWINDTKSSQDYWREQAGNHWQVALSSQDVKDGKGTPQEIAGQKLSEQLKEEISEGAPLKQSGLYTELLNAAISEVDWYEIAEDLLLDARKREESTAMQDDEHPIFGPVISRHTRAEAIQDGDLIDVSEMAQEAGITYPTAVTSALWADYVRVPEGVTCQDEQGRLWDILNMFRFATKKNKGKDILRFEVLVRNDNRKPKLVSLKAICGPGDTWDPVITIMLPDED
jgi:hypothetical protein